MTHWALALVLAAASGCTVIVDDAIRDPDGGMSGDPCAGAADGTACGDGRVCIDEICELSECGDDVVDEATEECDDGNEEPLDGCEDDCTFTCVDAADCDDDLECNGVETCTADNTCAPGTAPGDGTACLQDDGTDGVCRGPTCVAAGCGNMLPDTGEECDDGNMMPGDGCEPDCTFSCELDSDCDDGSVCTGTESCDVASHTCVAGTAMTCDDMIACTSNECDPLVGCVYPLIDMDGDMHASQDLGACGDDCNDMREDVSPSAVELCGDALDSDCDGNVNPAATPVWYRDCDNDGYAALGAVTMTACSEPPGTSGCTAWTTRVPISGDRTTYDCNDANATVRPSQTGWFSTAIAGASSSVDFDYDCNVMEVKRYGTVYSSGSCFTLFGTCGGAEGWTGVSSAPACGASGSYTYCLDRGSCVRATVTRTQTCH